MDALTAYIDSLSPLRADTAPMARSYTFHCPVHGRVCWSDECAGQPDRDVWGETSPRAEITDDMHGQWWFRVAASDDEWLGPYESRDDAACEAILGFGYKISPPPSRAALESYRATYL